MKAGIRLAFLPALLWSVLVASADADTVARNGIAVTGSISGSSVTNQTFVTQLVFAAEEQRSDGNEFWRLMDRLGEALGFRKALPGTPPDALKVLNAPASPAKREDISRLLTRYENTSSMQATAELYLARGYMSKPDVAVEDFGRAFVIGAGKPRYALPYGSALLIVSRPQEAAKVYDTLLIGIDARKFGAVDPLERVSALIGRAWAAFDLVDFDTCSASLSEALALLRRITPPSPAVLQATFEVLLRKSALSVSVSQLQEASASLDEAEELSRRNPTFAILFDRTTLLLMRIAVGEENSDAARIRSQLSQLAEGDNRRLPSSPMLVEATILLARVEMDSDFAQARTDALEAVRRAEELAANFPGVPAELSRIFANITLAEVELRAGNRNALQGTIDGILSMARELARAHPEQRVVSASAMGAVSDLVARTGDLDRAARLCVEASGLVREVAPSAPPVKGRILPPGTIVRLELLLQEARINIDRKDVNPAAAVEALREARTLAEVDRAFDPEVAQAEALTAAAALMSGDPSANQKYDDALSSAAEIVRHTDRIAGPRIFSVLELACSVGDAQTIVGHCQRAITIMQTVRKNKADDGALAQLKMLLAQAMTDTGAASKDALVPVEEALKLLSGLAQDDPGVQVQIAAAEYSAAQLDGSGSYEMRLGHAVGALQKAGPVGPDDLAAEIKDQVATLDIQLEHYQEAEAAALDAKDHVRKLVSADGSKWNGLLANVLSDLGASIVLQGRDGSEILQQSIDLYHSEATAGHPFDQARYGRDLDYLGRKLIAEGKAADSVPLLVEAEAVFRQLALADPNQKSSHQAVVIDLKTARADAEKNMHRARGPGRVR